MNGFVEQLDMKVLGKRLQKVRQHIGLKQSEVAAEIGCAPLTISRMERGETSTSLLPLLVFYSQTIDLNLLFGTSFNPDDEAVYSKNQDLQTLVKKRLEKLEEYYRNHLKDSQDNYAEMTHETMEKMFQKLNKKMQETSEKQSKELLKRLSSAINLL